MSDIIHLLPDSVANQIAAGEVIQRPASVVKELTENAIDAGATQVTIIVKGAGRTSIQVIDNGQGMSETDARMAFERHATSKIAVADDLFSLRTMGFRGEALASIAAVAIVELRTRTADSDVGTLLEIAGSQVIRQDPIACDYGTSFTIKNLFYNVPARRKFLKSDETEMRQIIMEFQRVALSTPQVGFELYNGDDIVYQAPASNLHQRIEAILGKRTRHLSDQIVQIGVTTSLVTITGYVGKPEFASHKAQQFFFVNGRYMRHPYFHRAVMQAYDRMLQPDTMPSYMIYFKVNPTDIDVNIHPTKTEIKFENERDVWQILLACIKESLGKFNIAPSIDFDTEGKPDFSVITHGATPPAPQPIFNSHYNPFNRQQTTPADGWEQLYRKREAIPATAIPQIPSEQPQLFRHSPGERVFVYKERWLITPIKSGLMIIDGRRACERIFYERILQQLEQQKSTSQRILFPEICEFSPDDDLVFQRITDDLKAMGFDIEAFGPRTYSIIGVPGMLSETSEFTSLIDEIVADVRDKAVRVSDKLFQRIAVKVAERAARNHRITDDKESTTYLIDTLFASTTPNLTPNGKTVVVILDDDELLRRFG